MPLEFAVLIGSTVLIKKGKKDEELWFLNVSHPNNMWRRLENKGNFITVSTAVKRSYFPAG